MVFDLFTPIILGCARHALTAIGGAIVANGYMTSSQDQQFIGAMITLIGISWSALEKVIDQRKLAAADPTGSTGLGPSAPKGGNPPGPSTGSGPSALNGKNP